MIRVGFHRGFSLFRNPFTRGIEITDGRNIVAEVHSDDDATDAQREADARRVIDELLDNEKKPIRAVS
jgi:hypothetical protein